MSCEATTDTFVITQGDDAIISAQILVNNNGTLTPKDLTLHDEIKAIFIKADKTKLTKTLTASGGVTKTSAIGGVIAITIPRAETAVLKTGEFQSFEVELITDNGTGSQKNQIVLFSKVLTVNPRLSC